MAGRTSFPLDSTQISMYYLIDPANVETVIVDQRLSDEVSFVMFYFKIYCQLSIRTLKTEIDLRNFCKIKKVYTYGRLSEGWIKANVPFSSLDEQFDKNLTDESSVLVKNYEEKANKQTVMTGLSQ